MVSPFLAPANAWHMMHSKADAMGMTHRVEPFLDWLRAATIELLQGIGTLTSLDLVEYTMSQQQGIRTSLVPPPPLRTPRSSIFRCSSPSSCKRRPHLQPPRGRR